MIVLPFTPLQSGYQAQCQGDYQNAQAQSGIPRRRRVCIGSTRQFSLQFALQKDELDAFLAFWRHTRDKPFACKVDIGQGVAWQRLRWADTPSVSHQGAQTFLVSAKAVSDTPIEPPDFGDAFRAVASALYPVDHYESYQAHAKITAATLFDEKLEFFGKDAYAAKADLVAAVLLDRVATYTDNNPDAYAAKANLTATTLFDQVFEHRQGKQDAYQVGKAAIVAAVLFDKVFAHRQVDPDGYFVGKVDLVAATLFDQVKSHTQDDAADPKGEQDAYAPTAKVARVLLQSK